MPTTPDDAPRDVTKFQPLVMEFHRIGGRPFAEAGDYRADLADVSQALDLVLEEVEELRQAVASGKIVAIAHELADVVYTAYGAAVIGGIDLDETLLAVHQANLSRPEDGHSGAEGKVPRGRSYVAPRIAELLGVEPDARYRRGR